MPNILDALEELAKAVNNWLNGRRPAPAPVPARNR